MTLYHRHRSRKLRYSLWLDAKGNLKTITNALGKITNIEVNAQGQPTKITDPLGNFTTFTYELGDLIAVKDPLNRETRRMLDTAGRLRSIINPLGQKTVYTPDALDRITQLTDAINGVTQFDKEKTKKRGRESFLDRIAGIRIEERSCLVVLDSLRETSRIMS